MNPLSIDQKDLILLNALQEDLPLVHNPWEIIGNQIGMTGEEVLTRIKLMEETGIFRGIFPTLESAKRGTIVSTLVAMRVQIDRISDVAAIVNEYPEVSHNFRRNHEFNLWFTLAANSPLRIDEIISEIVSRIGIHPDDMLNLKTERRFKIDVRFPLLSKPGGDE